MPSFNYSKLNISSRFPYNNNIYNIINYNNNNFFSNDMINKERPERSSIIGIGDCIVDIITEINSQTKDIYHLEDNKKK